MLYYNFIGMIFYEHTVIFFSEMYDEKLIEKAN